MKYSFNGNNVIAEAENIDESIALLKTASEDEGWYSVNIEDGTATQGFLQVDEPTVCNLCGFKAKTIGGLRVHTVRKHEGRSWTSNPKGKKMKVSSTSTDFPFLV